jgi:ribosomal protein S27AE
VARKLFPVLLVVTLAVMIGLSINPLPQRTSTGVGRGIQVAAALLILAAIFQRSKLLCPSCANAVDAGIDRFCPTCGSDEIHRGLISRTTCGRCHSSLFRRRHGTRCYAIHFCTHCDAYLDRNGL